MNKGVCQMFNIMEKIVGRRTQGEREEKYGGAKEVKIENP